MPPFNKRRSPGDIRRWRRSIITADTQPLVIRDDFDDESDENSSPISKQSDMPFTFERKRGDDHDDEEEEDSNQNHGGSGNGAGTSKDMLVSTIKGRQVGDGLEPESDSDLDPESDVESDIGSDLVSDDGSDNLNDSLPPPPPPSPPPSPRSTVTAKVSTTFTPLPPPATTTAATPAFTLNPNTPAPIETSPTTIGQRPSDMFVPVVEPTIGSPTTDAIRLTMTTTPLSEATTQPRKGLNDPVTTTDTIWVTASAPIQSAVAPTSTNLNFPPIYTVLPDSDPTLDQDNDDYHHDKKDKEKLPPPGLDPTAEHLLIAAGAIGAFILVCFVGWIVYRTMKKSKNNPWGGNNLTDKLPWRRRDAMGGSWANAGMYPPTEPPPLYEKGEVNSMQGAGYYGAGKAYPPGPGSIARSATGTSPRQQQEPDLESEPALAGIIDQYPEGNGGTLNRNDPGQTLGAQMPDSYYSQSGLTPQGSDSYDPRSRQAYRASELSSISSGFGDGEMIIPQTDGTNTNTNTIAKPPPIPTSNNAAGRFSWMSRGDGRRETVYTQTSEDRPARFRSVASWVNQQTGRVKRADSRARERGEVPVMPAIPGQISATQQTTYR